MHNFTSRFRSKWLLSTLLFFISFIAGTYAQDNITVRGMVTGQSDGLTLPGVSVKLKGSAAGTTTNAEGRYVLNVPPDGVLVFSYVGYSAREAQVNGRSTVNMILIEESTSLNEVVVVGYGATRKKDLTGSVAVVNAKDFQKGNISTPEQLIAGKVPGVSIVSNSGSPGAGSTIRIRGGSSLNASNDPLIVIDGVPLESSNVSGASNPLSFINPNDIESFTVLKDASAAAIYGARAANGVIIITTKKGQSGSLKVNFTTVNSIASVTDHVEMLNADQFRTIVNERGSAAQKAMLGESSTNWQDLIYQNAFSTDNNISFSGGVKGLPYRLSVGYQNQDGVLKTDNLQRASAAFVLNPVLFDKHLKIDLNLKGSMQKARFANQAAIGAAVSFDPTQQVYSGNDAYNGYYEWLNSTNPTGLENLVGRNPLGLLNQRRNEGKPKRSIGNLQLDYKFHFLPDLHANLNLAYDISRGEGTTFVQKAAAEIDDLQGYSSEYKQNRQNTVVDFYLNYIKDIKSINSRIDVTAGYSYNDYLTKVYNYAAYNASGVKVIGSDPNFPFDKPHNRLVSYFARANYTLADRYLLTGTIRRDGSSRFSPENRYANFPSAAFAWTIKNEPFLKNNTTISNLKLRLGYGITGQQEGIGNYDYLAYYGLSTQTASYQFGDTFFQMYRPSGFVANRKWEETATANIAVDFGFLKDRLSGSLDFYQKKTSDLLNRVPQPAGTNFSATAVVNVGDMENKGVEFSLTGQAVRKKDLTLDLGFNITYNKNTITNLTVIPGDPNYIGFPSGGIAGGVGGLNSQINAVGGSKNTFFLYEQVYDQAVDPIEGVFVDQNKDGIINQDDLYKGKGADPNVYLGFNTAMTYKKWNAGFVLRANLGNYVYNNRYSQAGSLNQILGTAILYNASVNYLETGFQGGNGQQLLSDYYIQNGSFLKMDNLNLGYNAGKIFNGRASLQLSATVQNVFVITKYDGLDPEISSGIDNNFYPRPRTVSLGANLSF